MQQGIEVSREALLPLPSSLPVIVALPSLHSLGFFITATPDPAVFYVPVSARRRQAKQVGAAQIFECPRQALRQSTLNLTTIRLSGTVRSTATDPSRYPA